MCIKETIELDDTDLKTYLIGVLSIEVRVHRIFLQRRLELLISKGALPEEIDTCKQRLVYFQGVENLEMVKQWLAD